MISSTNGRMPKREPRRLLARRGLGHIVQRDAHAFGDAIDDDGRSRELIPRRTRSAGTPAETGRGSHRPAKPVGDEFLEVVAHLDADLPLGLRDDDQEAVVLDFLPDAGCSKSLTANSSIDPAEPMVSTVATTIASFVFRLERADAPVDLARGLAVDEVGKVVHRRREPRKRLARVP
jgi:hypothetical protein